MEEQKVLSDALLALYGEPGKGYIPNSWWDARSIDCHGREQAAVADMYG